jgi:hypothetical protein
VGTVVVGAVLRTGGPAEFVIETDDPDLAFRADGRGGVELEDRKLQRRYQLKVGRHDPATGEYEIDVTDSVGGLQFSTRTLAIKRGERVALKASLRATAPVKDSAVANASAPSAESALVTPAVFGVDEEWVRTVRLQPADTQVGAVVARLKALNPDFTGEVNPIIDDGAVVSLQFPTDQITNLAPLRGLPKLRELFCDNTWDKRGRLTDLRPLAAMGLKKLSVSYNDQLYDLGPVAGMPLEDLNCYYTAVSDVTPLQKCPIRKLNMGMTRIANFAGVAKLPLKALTCNDTDFSDLRPLVGMRLVNVEFAACPQLKDLSPLRGMPLQIVDIRRTPITDLTPLKGAPLRVLIGSQATLVAHRQLLDATPTLTHLNIKTVAEFWADVAAKKQPEYP